MRKYILIALLWGAFQCAEACDACSCSGAGMGGTFTFQSRDFFGLSFQQRTFDYNSSLMPGMSALQMSRLQLNGRYSPIKNLQFVGNFPFVFNKQGNITHTGVGDVSLMAQAVIWPIKDSASRFIGRLAFGGGVKLPTGKFNTQFDESMSASFQSGTGSLDYLFNLNYLQRFGKWGALLDGNRQINGVNKFKYRFGDQWSFSAKTARWIKLKNTDATVLQPELGLFYARVDKDVEGHQLRYYSGSQALDMSAGLNMMLGNCYFGFTFYHNLRQCYAEQMLISSDRLLLQFNYLFNQK